MGAENIPAGSKQSSVLVNSAVALFSMLSEWLACLVNGYEKMWQIHLTASW